MILEHYSREPLVWPPRDYEQANGLDDCGGMSMFKPTGLWVSVKGDDDWRWWCEAEDFRTDKLQVCTRVILSSEANLKVIQGESELIRFDEEYSHTLEITRMYSRHAIDWQRLASEYDGIVIAPYVWSCRLPYRNEDVARKHVSDWYYPWDCASGCIWNGTKAISAFEVVTEGAAIAAE